MDSTIQQGNVIIINLTKREVLSLGWLEMLLGSIIEDSYRN
jgi:hypothetical protein